METLKEQITQTVIIPLVLFGLAISLGLLIYIITSLPIQKKERPKKSKYERHIEKKWWKIFRP